MANIISYMANHDCLPKSNGRGFIFSRAYIIDLLVQWKVQWKPQRLQQNGEGSTMVLVLERGTQRPIEELAAKLDTMPTEVICIKYYACSYMKIKPNKDTL